MYSKEIGYLRPPIGWPEDFATWPQFSEDEIAVAADVLRSGKVNYWTGQEGRKFEQEFAKFVGCDHAIALSSGSVALELALHSLNIGPGDEVIVPCRTFIASASCIALRGALPVMADVDPVSQTVTAETIRPLITPRTRAIICVHLAGWPCDMDPILSLACEYGLKVVEDCAQSHGATYKGRQAGSMGDMAAFSFCQDKIMTTGGEGGMLTTNDKALWRKAWEYKDHGKNWYAASRREDTVGFRWLHDSFGTNWRLTEMQSAIGRTQLRKVPEWVRMRRATADVLTESFLRIPALRVTQPPPDIGHAYYKYYVFIRPECLKPGWDRDRILTAIMTEGIPCFSGICSEVYLEKAFEGLRPVERLPVARSLGETSLLFPVHPGLTEKNINDICKAVGKVMQLAMA